MILILSDADDQSTSEIVKWLDYFNKPWVRINGEDQIGFDNYELNDTTEKAVLKTASGEVVDFEKVTGYWYRRGYFAYNLPFDIGKIDDEELRGTISGHYQSELGNLSDGMYAMLANKKSINDFRFTNLNKLEMLSLAKKNGLQIPSTLIATTKKALDAFRHKHKAIVTKAIQNGATFGFWSAQKTRLEYFGYTEEFDEEVPVTFAPTLFQEKIEKKYELRVFFLGDDYYAMAIFSQLDDQTNVDFRKYNLKKPNRTVPYTLSDDITDKLKKLMKDLNLNSGSIDLLVNQKGEYIFLEVNPIGQFGMVSYPCNYYLEKQIANYL